MAWCSKEQHSVEWHVDDLDSFHVAEELFLYLGARTGVQVWCIIGVDIVQYGLYSI